MIEDHKNFLGFYWRDVGSGKIFSRSSESTRGYRERKIGIGKIFDASLGRRTRSEGQFENQNWVRIFWNCILGTRNFLWTGSKLILKIEVP